MANSNRAAATKRAAEMREAAARKDRQRKQLIAAVVAVIVVLIAVGVGIVISKQPPKETAAGAGTAAVAQLANLPAAAFDAAGNPGSNAIPKKIEGGAVLKDGDKPEVLYVGAEFCPYCASERWALVAALDRFGDFTGLEPTRSADNDGNLATVSFVNSKYTSDYVAFRAWETQDRNGKELQKVPDDVTAMLTKNNPRGSIPWTSFGTHETIGSGVPVDPFASLTGDDAWTKIVDQMKTGTGDVGQPVMASANAITAQICVLTNGQPANVCTSKAVVAASPLLQK